MTAKSDRPGGVRAAVRRAGRPVPARSFIGLIAALAAAVLLAAGCSTVSSSSSGSTAASSAAGTQAAPTGSAVAGGDIGITATTIRVAMIADVNSSLAPGLFQKSLNAVNAWASIVNASGGLAGRKVVVDFCDAKLDPNATTNCVIKACQNDFAMVGTAANALTDLSDIDGCKNAQGQAAGIPDLAAFAFQPLFCDPDTYVMVGDATYCATAKGNPQTYTVNVGDYRYYTSHFKNLNGIFVYASEPPSLKIDFVPEFQVGENLGIKPDGQGFYPESATAPQSALTPVVSVMKSAGATFAYGGGTPQNTILLEREAKLQGVNGVKVWASNSGIYDSSFIAQGGSTVNGTYATLNDLPFYTEYQDNPALAGLIKQMGGIANVNNNALNSYMAALLFQDAVTKAVANGGTLNRTTLFAALKNEHSFNADGIIGPTDIGNHLQSACFVLAQIQNGQWQRVWPAKAGTFDCSSSNLATIKLNLTL